MKEMKGHVSKGMLMCALICGTLASNAIPAFAGKMDNDSLSEFMLDPMVVTATRTEKKEVDIPAATEILTHEQIVSAGATNAMDAMRQVNGIEANNYFPGGNAMTTMTSRINIRGYGDYTLVMVNGNPVNLNSVYNIDAIPVEAIERIEIVKGGGAVLYGSEATGGVVNIITKKKANDFVTVGGGNFGQKKFDIGLGNDKFRLNYNLRKWGEVKDLSYSDKPVNKKTTTFTQDNSTKENIGVGFNITDTLSLDYNHFESKVDYHRNFASSGIMNQWRDTYTKEDLVQLNYLEDSLKGHIWYNKNKINYFGGELKENKWMENKVTRRENTAFGMDIQKDMEFNEKSLLTVGANYKYENLNQKLTKGVRPVEPEKTRNTWALFAQLDQKLNDKDSIILGGRETWTTGGWNGQNYSNFSASGQYLHKISDDQSMYAKIAQSFVMPTFSQMSPSGILGGVANPDLKPQKGMHYELGYKAAVGNHSWKAALFHMEVKDNISATVTTGASGTEYTYTNKDFRNTGFEASLDVAATKQLGYNLAFTIQNPEENSDAKDKKTGKILKPGWQRKFGKYQVKGGVNYNFAKLRTSLNGSYIWDRYSSPSGSDSYKIKPYFLTTFTATYSPDKNNTISLIVDNVLNRDDNVSNTGSNGGGYYTAPTNFLLSYTYKF